MAKRVQRQLKKQLEEQKSLEEEFEQLKNAKDAKESCAEVIKFVESTSMDPMPDTENNPFLINCFIGGTEILVEKSGKHKKIEEMKIGDGIVCIVPSHKTFKESIDCDIEDIPNHLCDAVVTEIYRSFSHRICCIKYCNANTGEENTVQCTDSHPIYVNKVGWKTVSGKSEPKVNYEFDISKLNIGDELCLETGTIAIITQIHIQHLNHAIPVYNLTASNGHTFFANGLFVHNKGICDKCIIL